MYKADPEYSFTQANLTEKAVKLIAGFVEKAGLAVTPAGRAYYRLLLYDYAPPSEEPVKPLFYWR